MYQTRNLDNLNSISYQCGSSIKHKRNLWLYTIVIMSAKSWIFCDLGVYCNVNSTSLTLPTEAGRSVSFSLLQHYVQKTYTLSFNWIQYQGGSSEIHTPILLCHKIGRKCINTSNTSSKCDYIWIKTTPLTLPVKVFADWWKPQRIRAKYLNM